MLYAVVDQFFCSNNPSRLNSQAPNTPTGSTHSLTDTRLRSVSSVPSVVGTPSKPRANGMCVRTPSELSLTSHHSYGDNISMISASSYVSVASEQNGSIASQDGGYNYTQHFDIFSPYTSTLALKYGNTLNGKLSKAQPPAVWSMDVANRLIALGCNNGSVEVSIYLFIVKFARH